MIEYSVVVPTIGRPDLLALLADLHRAKGPRPAEIIVVDDRPGDAASALPIDHFEGVRIVRGGGRGPAAARNGGWRQARGEWVAFLDDDVRLPDDWPARLHNDLIAAAPDVAASQARIMVPLPGDRRPTDDERGTAGLVSARWITADMAYRRAVLVEVGGFDERFPRAYREDADLALRVTEAGHAIERGRRVTTHPARHSSPLASLRAQKGNADNALMRRKHGRHWRTRVGEGNGRLGRHALTTAAAVAALGLTALGRRRAARACAVGWAGMTTEFAARRISAGPATVDEITRMLITSVLIPPTACAHRLTGELRHAGVRR
jgi:glycosyltransferase involved in cell wall biosynthesis